MKTISFNLSVSRSFFCGLMILFLFFNGLSLVARKKDDLSLWYKTPAAQWKESLPIGNGRLGTMIAGNIFSDTLVINEETVWSGSIHDYVNPLAKGHLGEIRRLIREGEYDKALAVGDKYMIGVPRKQQHYQPLGALVFDFEHQGEITDYKRTLSLNKAIVTVSYKCHGQVYKREYFASFPDQVMIMRFSTDDKSGMSFSVRHKSEHISGGSLKGAIYKMSGSAGDETHADIKFQSNIEVVKGKKSIRGVESGFKIRGEKEVVLVYTAATNFIAYNDVSGNPEKICDQILSQVRTKNYPALLASHTADYSKVFNRVEINLGAQSKSEKSTPELIALAKRGDFVPYLDELFYQMGRYLTIAGSRVGTQPLNLQGIWNNDMNPPWGCKWTLNINLPMNYWMAEAGNLAECHEPLFHLLYDIRETGTTIAREHYGCRGFVAHHNTDLWRGAAPVDGANWGLWTLGGAWLTRHLWEHFVYSQDIEFLKKAYPYMKEASLFFFDFLTEGDQGFWVTSPAVSFEQSFKLLDGKVGRLCEGPTMDNQILRDLFTNCLAASKIMNDNKHYQDSLVLMRGRLKPTTIDESTGQLMEWASPAFPQKISGQLAPLWALNPGSGINYASTPELANAAEKTIRDRDPFVAVYETTGSWVSGTRANFWARLGKGDESYSVYHQLVKNNLFPNLLASFYPKKYFMIDGNIGTASAFNEMLLQSQRVNEDGQIIIDLLPALPSQWKDGFVRGIRSRGGFELEIYWQNGALTEVIVHSKAGKLGELVYKNKSVKIDMKKGKVFKWVI